MKCKKIALSSIVVAILGSGCVKPTQQPVQSTATNTATISSTQGGDVYSSQQQVVYEDSTPVVYEDSVTTTAPTTSTSSSGVYQDNTVVSTGGYQTVNSTTYGATTIPQSGSYGYGSTSTTASQSGSYGSTSTTTPQSGSYGSTATNPAYGNPYESGGGSGSYNIDDYSPSSYGSYGSSSSSHSSYGSYTLDTPYSSGSSHTSYSSSSTGSSIGLQVAALRDYYAAQEFKNSLSIPSKYHAYIKKGAINKVIITGFSSRSEAKALANRQFPGAFIVSAKNLGSSGYTSSSSYSSYSSHSSSVSSSSIKSGIGVQVGAFSSKSSARAAAQRAAHGKYTAIVKTAKVRGRTIYKAIVLGFKSRADAKRAIASGEFGDAFVVSNVYP